MSNKPLVYKFGGASVKDAEAVRNLSQIIKNSGITSKLVVVVSAMGKMTNALEKLIRNVIDGNNYDSELNEIRAYHIKLIDDLFVNNTQALSDFNDQIHLLDSVLHQANRMDYNFAYDQIAAFGELFSTKIISNYLNQENINNEWIDAKRCILTDSNHRNATVNFEWSTIFTKKNTADFIDDKIIVTQGFISSDSDGNTTTLGREGSDYSASIFASCLDAESVTIWKDVDGILNADPKRISSPVKYDRLSYEEVIEMSYYGATVIHPKTIKPLALKNIPLVIRSFINPDREGTEVGVLQHDNIEPALIIKENQGLVSFRKRDFSFMEENNIGYLMGTLSQLGFKINLVQKSALNFSIVTDFDETKFEEIISATKENYFMHYNSGLQLITIKNYQTLEIPSEIECSEVLLEQKTRKNIQYLVK